MATGKRKEPEEHGIVPIEGERERIIELLSQHFANDTLSLEELERRIELAYRATSLPALREITRDLPGPSAVVPRPASAPPLDVYAPEYDRIVSIMANTKRRGIWRPARDLDLWSVMSETHLDLTEALLAEGVTEIDIHAVMASVKIIVPPGVRVVMQVGSFMAEVNDDVMEPPAVGSGAPVIRITGFVFMSELKVRVRHRELHA